MLLYLCHLIFGDVSLELSFLATEFKLNDQVVCVDYLHHAGASANAHAVRKGFHVVNHHRFRRRNAHPIALLNVFGNRRCVILILGWCIGISEWVVTALTALPAQQ